MTVNPNGYVNVADGGAPRIISGYAQAAISGGWFVTASGAAAVVGSSLSSFVTSDIVFRTPASGLQFTGIALHNAASGAPLAVATRGQFIVTAQASVPAGWPIQTDGDHAVTFSGFGSGGLCIGRALTGAGSEGFCIVDIHG
jgi:hypothetical protein